MTFAIEISDSKVGSWFFDQVGNQIPSHQVNREAIVPFDRAQHRSIFGLLSQYTFAMSKLGFGSASDDPVVNFVGFSQFLIDNGRVKLEELDLSNQDLAQLPPHIKLFTKLKSLNLSGNALRMLPDLSALSQLEVLDLSGNDEVILPDLSMLTKLRILRLNRVSLVEIPEWMGKMPSLETVDLSDNPLQVTYPHWWDFATDRHSKLFELPDDLDCSWTQPE